MTDPETTVSRRGFLRTGMGVATLSGVTGVASAQQPGTQTGTPTGTGTQAGTATGGTATGTETGGGTAGAEGQTHMVEMTNDLVYQPNSITISPGDTIRWENVGSIGHSVTAYANDIPGEAQYFASGGFDSEEAARSAYTAGDPDSGFIGEGEAYEHTFQTTGEYQYFCIPHEAAGMVGDVTVSEAGGAGGGATTPAGPQVPQFATNVAMALTTALLSVLSVTYLFIKFGGDYSFDEGD